jgi:hypothetical protein
MFHRPPSSRPSPQGEGEFFPAPLENPATGFAGRASAKSRTCDCNSFSPGEKARMRAVVKTNSFSNAKSPSRPSQNEICLGSARACGFYFKIFLHRLAVRIKKISTLRRTAEGSRPNMETVIRHGLLPAGLGGGRIQI